MERTQLARINFHHLHYFWAVAREGNLTRTAEQLRVAQSALSAQIRQLEDELGTALFERQGRRLVLTEAGRIALTYADDIFATGGELVATLRHGRRPGDAFRVGAVSTLSRNFQESFIKPLLEQPRLRLRVEAGRLDDLLERLARHQLDVVLSNQPAPRAGGGAWRSRRLARQAVSIIGRPRERRLRFPADLDGAPMILPTPDSDIRTEFDAFCEKAGVAPLVSAEVDDMATMRLLARDTESLALLPSVVVRDELRSGVLVEHSEVPGVFETFYAVSVERHFQHPLMSLLLKRDEEALLAMDEDVVRASNKARADGPRRGPASRRR